MTKWTADELNKIGRADELQVASLRPDGTSRKPVTVWVVQHGGDLYVRSVRGPDAAWYRGTQQSHESSVTSGNVEKRVLFERADLALNGQIDAAYRAKYRPYPESYVDSIVAPIAQSTTIRLVPR